MSRKLFIRALKRIQRFIAVRPKFFIRFLTLFIRIEKSLIYTQFIVKKNFNLERIVFISNANYYINFILLRYSLFILIIFFFRKTIRNEYDE